LEEEAKTDGGRILLSLGSVVVDVVVHGIPASSGRMSKIVPASFRSMPLKHKFEKRENQRNPEDNPLENVF
jgi:hypothetical protein